MSKATDRRRRIRVPVQQKIKHSIYQVLGTPVFEENSAIDLSSNGISFVTSQKYQKGALVLLEVELGKETLKLLVCVAWIRRSKTDRTRYDVGAELIAIDPEHKKQMQGHLSKLIQQFTAKKPTKKLTKKSTQKTQPRKRK